MSCLNPTIVNNGIQFEMQECISRGKELLERYTAATPFPHIVLDDFLSETLLGRVVDEFPAREPRPHSDAHSVYKAGYTLERITSAYITNLLFALNSAQFLSFLEQMTGIEGLISDPYYVGGGLHETGRGGHLSIHADFNVQQKLKLIRRLNLILYLNKNWSDDYGGHLELWHRDMSGMARKVAPIMGRAVVFNTDSDSYHGHPDPLMAPPDVFRRSIALYYYTSPSTNLDQIRHHSTQFRVRSGTGDRHDLKTMIYEGAKDLCPPVLWRWVRRQHDRGTEMARS